MMANAKRIGVKCLHCTWMIVVHGHDDVCIVMNRLLMHEIEQHKPEDFPPLIKE